MATVTKPRKKTKQVAPALSVEEVCRELQVMQRYRTANLKTRIRFENRRKALVTSFMGYHSGMSEEERDRMYKLATDTIKTMPEDLDWRLKGLIHAGQDGINSHKGMVYLLEKEMIALAKQLPVASWVNETQQRGFGLLGLGIIIGETGDLSLYANPGKVWRRLGLAPYESQGKVLMGRTWRLGKEGTLSSTEWSDFGYSKRRRAVVYVMAESLLKSNQSVYRSRYDQAKRDGILKHPDWQGNTCKECEGAKCEKCLYTGKTCKRAHLHGMLLMGKLLIKNLWCQWNPDLVKYLKH